MRVKGNEAANGGNGDSRQESETKYLSRWCEMTMDTMRSMNHSLLEMNKSNVTQSLHPGFMTKYGHYLNGEMICHISVRGLCEGKSY